MDKKIVPFQNFILNNGQQLQNSINIKEQKLHEQANIKVIDDFLIFMDCKIGQGCLSEIYLCCKKSQNIENQETTFVVKIYNQQTLQLQQDQKNLIENEIINTHDLPKSENIINQYHTCRTARNIYRFIDFCNGGSFNEYIQNKNYCLSINEILSFLHQIIFGYEILYKNGIIHKGLTTNSLLLHYNQIKIGNFKYGVFNKNKNPNSLCVNDYQIPDPQYASPQVLNQEAFSSKCDVWSLGIILYEMCYGVKPFIMKSTKAVYQEILEKTQGKQLLALPVSSKIDFQVKELIVQMLMFREQDRISWQEIFNLQIFRAPQNLKPITITTSINFIQQNWLELIKINKQSIGDYFIVEAPYTAYKIPIFEDFSMNGDAAQQKAATNYSMFKFRENNFVRNQKINKSFFFQRNQALYANIVLQNLVKNIDQLRLQPSIFLAICYLLIAYYYYKLLYLENQFNPDLASQYQIQVGQPQELLDFCQSNFYQTCRSQITQDYSLAKILFTALDDKLIQEIKQGMQSLQINLQQQSSSKSSQEKMISSKIRNEQEFFSSFFKLVQGKTIIWTEYRELLKKYIKALTYNIDINKLNQSALKSLLGLQIFCLMDKLIPGVQFLTFNFQSFLTFQLINLTPNEYKLKIEEYYELLK